MDIMTENMRNAAAKTALACTVALSLVSSGETPDKFVRYVESTGSQYIDTGIIGRYGTKAECKVAWMNYADSAFLACGNYSNNTRFYMCYCSSNAGNMFTAQRTGDKVHSNESGHDLLFEKKRVYSYTSEFSAPYGDGSSTNTVYIDGTKVFTVGKQGLDTATNLYIFACNRNGSAVSHSRTRCYGLKIWQDNALVRDFRPCVHGGRAGLYDAQNDKIYYPSGGDLVYDTNCDVPDAFIDYVESFGNSYIDTGIIGRAGTGAKMEIEPTYDYDNAFLASRNGDNRFYLIHSNGSGQWGYGYGGYAKFGSLATGRKYYVDSSFKAGSQVIKIGENGPDGATTTYVNATGATSIDTGRSMYISAATRMAVCSKASIGAGHASTGSRYSRMTN